MAVRLHSTPNREIPLFPPVDAPFPLLSRTQCPVKVPAGELNSYMGYASASPTIPAKPEVERVTGQHSESSQTITNLPSEAIRNALPPSEDQKRLFPDFEVGLDAEVINTPSNTRPKENMRNSVGVGGFKPVNTLSGRNSLDYEPRPPVKTYGRTKRVHMEMAGNENAAVGAEPWDLHSEEVLEKRKKPRSEKSILISDGEGEAEITAALPEIRTSPRHKTLLPPRIYSGAEPRLRAPLPISNHISEYNEVEKKMKDTRHSGKTNSGTDSGVGSISRVPDKSLGNQAVLSQHIQSDQTTDTITVQGQRKRQNRPPLGGLDLVETMFSPRNGGRNGVNERPQSKQAVEEISDDDDDDNDDNDICEGPPKPYTGTAFQRKPVKSTNPIKPPQALKRRGIQPTTTSSRYFSSDSRLEPKQVMQGPGPRTLRRPLNSVFGRLGNPPNTPQNTRDTFKRTDDIDESPDVLQSDANVGDGPQPKPKVRDRMTANQDTGNSPASPVDVVRDRQPSLPSSPADISRTQFTQQRQANTRQSNTGTRNSKRIEDAIFPIRMLDSGLHTFLPLCEETFAYQLLFNSREETLIPCSCGKCGPLTHDCTIPPIQIKKTMKLFTCKDDGLIIEIQLPRDGPIDSTFVALYQGKDLMPFVGTIQGVSNCFVASRSSDLMTKRYETHIKNKERWKQRLQDRPSEKDLDDHAQLIQDKKDHRKLKRAEALSDIEITAKRQRFEPNEGRPLGTLSSARHPRHLDDSVQDVFHDNPHETRSRSKFDKKTRTDVWQDSEEIRRNTPPAPKVSTFSILKRELKKSGKEWGKPLLYPSDGLRRATVDFDDLERLDEGEFLNDNIIAFYLRYLERELELTDSENSKRVYFFNTFFYERLTKGNTGKQGINYEGVQKWTSKIDIFDFDYVVVPVNESAHWYVTIICNLPNLARTLGQEQPITSVEDSTKDIASYDGNDDRPAASAEQSSQLLLPRPKETSTDRALHETAKEDRINVTSPDQSETTAGSPNVDSTSKMEESSEKPLDINDGEDAEWPNEEENQLEHPSSRLNNRITCIVEVDAARPEASNANPERGEIQTKAKAQQKQKKAKRRASLRKYEVNDAIIITLDSLGLPHNTTARNLKEYLIQEGKTKRQLDIPIEKIAGMNSKEIPLQDNYCDCGVFLLGYIERFLQNPKSFVDKILRREMDLVEDWPDLNPSEKRDQLRELIRRLHNEQDMASRESTKSRGKNKRNGKLVSEKGSSVAVDDSKEYHQEKTQVPTPLSVSYSTETSTLAEDTTKTENGPELEESLVVLSSHPTENKSVPTVEEEKEEGSGAPETPSRVEEGPCEHCPTPTAMPAKTQRHLVIEGPETQEPELPDLKELMEQEKKSRHEIPTRKSGSRSKEVIPKLQPQSRSPISKQPTHISID